MFSKNSEVMDMGIISIKVVILIKFNMFKIFQYVFYLTRYFVKCCNQLCNLLKLTHYTIYSFNPF